MSLLNEFCAEFGASEEALGTVTRVGRQCFIATKEAVATAKTVAKGADVFAVGVYLGEEKRTFQPSPALVELLASKVATTPHHSVVDEKAAWLFLCGRDLFTKGILESGTPTKKGFVLVENEQGENLGYGRVVTGLYKGNVAVKQVLDRGHYLRRERKKT